MDFRSQLALAFSLLAGCGKSEPSGPPTYRYALLVDGRAPTKGATVRINGKDAGTDVGNVTVPREVWLSDPATVLELVVPTTCGTETMRLLAVKDRATEDVARSAPTVSWSPGLPPSFPWRTDGYLDNQSGKRPTKIRVGIVEHEVAPGSALKVPLTIGLCPTARRIEIDGKHVGDYTGKDDRSAALIAAIPDQCYVWGTGVWTSMKAIDVGSMADAAVFRMAGHVHAMPRVDYFPAKTAPETLMLSAVTGTEARKILDPLLCPLAAKFEAARRRGAH